MSFAQTLKPFHADTFNAIKGLGDANDIFLSHNGPKLVYSSIMDLFRRCGVSTIFAVCLVHRHFSLSHDEILVDTNGSATRWNMQNAVASGGNHSATQTYTKYGGSIQPMSWAFNTTGHLMPYEFFFEPAGSVAAANSQERPSLDDLFSQHIAFFKEFRDILDKNNLRDILGLRLCRDTDPPHGTIEFTEHQCNITVPAEPGFIEKVQETDRSRFIPATWSFKETEGDDTAAGFPDIQVGRCKTVCTTPDSVSFHMDIHTSE